MKNALSRFRSAGLLATSLLALLMPTLASATAISITPSTLNASIGEPITASLVVSGLTSTLGAYDIDVSVNPSVLAIPGLNSLSPTNVAFSDALGNPNDPTQTAVFFGGDTNPITGTEELIDISLLDPSALANLQPSTSFTLATLNFTVVGSGSTSITPGLPSSGIALSDAYGNPLSVTTFNAATVNILSVPEPSSMTLLLAGLAVIGVMLTLRQRRFRLRTGSVK